MKQNINLYQVEKEKKTFVFSFDEMLRLLSLVGVLLFMISLYHVVNHFRIASEYKKAEKKQAEANEKLRALQGKVPSQQTREQLVNEIKKLEEEKNYKEQMIATLSEAKIQKYQGFSNYLEALSREAVPGIWLTRMVFKKDKNYFSLEGGTLKPELLPKLITGLSKEPAFIGKTFQYFKLETNKETHELHFLLETEITKKT